MTREECLIKAKECVCGGRETDYGKPEDNFGEIAALWSAWRGEAYTAQDVAAMMALLKIARIGGNRATVDSWVDLAGYAACGCEIATCGVPMDAERTFDDMTYRGYRGTLRYSAEDRLYIGEVLGTKDYLCYHGGSELEARMQFKMCVDWYVEQRLTLDKLDKKEEARHAGEDHIS
ncbi:MAG: DUF6378 domain-containing protein [Clostridiales bacterium]|nr:DUF6378 domain-containing protein [Clostridiales bacterium]